MREMPGLIPPVTVVGTAALGEQDELNAAPASTTAHRLILRKSAVLGNLWRQLTPQGGF